MNKSTYRIIVVLLSFSVFSVLAVQSFWIKQFYNQKLEAFNNNVYSALEQITSKLNDYQSLHALKMTYFIQNGDTIAKTPSRRMLIRSEEDEQIINASGNKVITRQITKTVSNGKSYKKALVIQSDGANINMIMQGKNSRLIVNSPTSTKTNIEKEIKKELQTEEELNRLINKVLTEINVIENENIQSDTLRAIIKTALDNKGIFIPFEFSLQKNDSNQNKILAQSKTFNQTASSFKNNLSANKLLNHHRLLYLQFPNQSSLVLASMKSSLLLSILFSIIIIATFYYALRLISKQKKLSDIKNDFINNTTHELKTPIATISLALDAMNNDALKTDETKRNTYMQIVKEENKKLNKHVERVLQMANLDKGEFEFNFTKVNVAVLLEQVIKNMQLQIEQKEANVVLRMSATKTIILADETHLGAVFLNLIDNALKYSNQHCQIEIDVLNIKSQLVVIVKDNGIGIDAKVKDKIFDKFYRVQGGYLHDVKGFGLGLSYLKSVLEAHHANIEVYSELGKGSEFMIQFKQHD